MKKITLYSPKQSKSRKKKKETLQSQNTFIKKKHHTSPDLSSLSNDDTGALIESDVDEDEDITFQSPVKFSGPIKPKENKQDTIPKIGTKKEKKFSSFLMGKSNYLENYSSMTIQQEKNSQVQSVNGNLDDNRMMESDAKIPVPPTVSRESPEYFTNIKNPIINQDNKDSIKYDEKPIINENIEENEENTSTGFTTILENVTLSEESKLLLKKTKSKTNTVFNKKPKTNKKLLLTPVHNKKKTIFDDSTSTNSNDNQFALQKKNLENTLKKQGRETKHLKEMLIDFEENEDSVPLKYTETQKKKKKIKTKKRKVDTISSIGSVTSNKSKKSSANFASTVINNDVLQILKKEKLKSISRKKRDSSKGVKETSVGKIKEKQKEVTKKEKKLKNKSNVSIESLNSKNSSSSSISSTSSSQSSVSLTSNDEPTSVVVKKKKKKKKKDKLGKVEDKYQKEKKIALERKKKSEKRQEKMKKRREEAQRKIQEKRKKKVTKSKLNPKKRKLTEKDKEGPPKKKRKIEKKSKTSLTSSKKKSKKRKIPDWAKGEAFRNQLGQQKSMDVKTIFGVTEGTVDLSDCFPNSSNPQRFIIRRNSGVPQMRFPHY